MGVLVARSTSRPHTRTLQASSRASTRVIRVLCCTAAAPSAISSLHHEPMPIYASTTVCLLGDQGGLGDRARAAHMKCRRRNWRVVGGAGPGRLLHAARLDSLTAAPPAVVQESADVRKIITSNAGGGWGGKACACHVQVCGCAPAGWCPEPLWVHRSIKRAKEANRLRGGQVLQEQQSSSSSHKVQAAGGACTIVDLGP